MKKILLFLVLSTVIFLWGHEAKSQSASIINEVIVQGNQRVETETIKRFLSINTGSRYSDVEINNAVSKLFATGLFADVNADRNGENLVVKVDENPVVNEVAFEGNRRIEEEDLLQEVTLKPRGIYTKTDLQNDVKRVVDLYQKSGRFSAIVTPKVISLEQNRVNIVFEIDEGDRTDISTINFVGNRHFSDETLRSEIQTKESRWYKFFSSDDAYDQDRLAFDQELLRRFYIANGFADFRVTSATAELTPERDAFIITFSIEEGDVYTFGSMGVESEISQVNTNDLVPLIRTETGETFNAEMMDKSIEEMTQYLGDFGYAFVDIKPQITRNAEEDIISVIYLVKEAPRVYVEQINIRGNVRTLDEVVRREFRVAEGDPYNTSKIKRSEQRIKNLDFFSKADISTERGSAEDKVNINVDVEEKSTGEFSVGAGFSSTDGALGDVSLVERNLLGKGQSLRLNGTLASSRQQINLGFTEPYFLNHNVAAGFDIFKTKRSGNTSTNNFTYDLDSIGGALRAGYPITEHLRHDMRYSLKSDNITNINTNASTFIQQQEGKNTTSLIGNTLSYDKRDSKVDPRNGYYSVFILDVAGLGGNSKFVRNELRGGYYVPTFSENWIFQTTGKTGYLTGIAGEDVRINNRFFLGGRDVRGFESDGIGPRDTTTSDPLGGNFYYAGTVEQSFPLGLSEEFGLSGAVFSDIGSLFQVDDTGSNVADTGSVRASAGVGIAWTSPVGPIRVDYAEAFLKEDFDELEPIRFNFGTKF